MKSKITFDEEEKEAKEIFERLSKRFEKLNKYIYEELDQIEKIYKEEFKDDNSNRK